MREKMEGGLLSVRQFARAVGIDEFSVYRWLWKGKIAGKRQNGKWKIPSHIVKEIKKCREVISLKKIKLEQEVDDLTSTLEAIFDEADSDDPDIDKILDLAADGLEIESVEEDE